MELENGCSYSSLNWRKSLPVRWSQRARRPLLPEVSVVDSKASAWSDITLLEGLWFQAGCYGLQFVPE
ncbi:hypothetical protein HPP92_029031 [Vanilla planifolia]|uniref:Uncharacterized protein n=1 Tax=Vanilla planifolia TaxID=51239 RepID=A0A835U349_VANPL|nr:hypothetical protein HPP92_029031 [Vanilla planifolia]